MADLQMLCDDPEDVSISSWWLWLWLWQWQRISGCGKITFSGRLAVKGVNSCGEGSRVGSEKAEGGGRYAVVARIDSFIPSVVMSPMSIVEPVRSPISGTVAKSVNSQHTTSSATGLLDVYQLCQEAASPGPDRYRRRLSPQSVSAYGSSAL